ncbi:MAG: hypothetical protein M1840_000555 [Geoglossum simile]|nr:MAG: hypothetical protein M1840_000555 [Geoglossum simile]
MATTRESTIGLKVLYDVVPATTESKSLVDVVAVHGIGADPDTTWTTQRVNWLKDEQMLPFAVPDTRILRFAYESQWLGKEALQQRLSLVADQLLHSLMGSRKTCTQRPIVFIGHCFGGLVIEKALLNARLHEEDYPDIIRSVAGIIFLGTPHRGSSSQSAASLIATIASSLHCGERSSLLKAVEKDSEMLTDLVYDFTRMVNIASIPLFCFFEQHKSDIAKVVKPKVSFWPSYKDTIVDERSGCIDGFPKLGLACDHFHINKFSSPKDGNYHFVQSEVTRFVKEAPDRVHHRIKPLPTRQRTKDFNEERDQACLHAIFITDPFDDMGVIENKKNRLLENTGIWILSNPFFTRWLNENLSSILWVHGDPGKGKTMLAISLVRELSNKVQLEGSPANTTLAYFFCDNKDDRRKTASAILRGLIYQILCQRPDLIFHLRSEYERQKEQLISSPNSLQSLWRVLQNILKYSNFEKVYIIIDAIDECEPDSIEMFLALLEPYTDPWHNCDNYPQKDSSCKIKWLLTSRNEDAIKQPLSGCLEIGLEQNAAHVDEAIRKFIDQSVKQLKRSKHYNATLCQFVEEYLHEKAEGTFLWVALACRELSKPTVRSMNTKSVLLQLPSGLSPLYSRIMEQVMGNEDEEMTAFAKAILQSMLVALRPLTLQEVAIAADLPKEYHHDPVALEEFINLCGSFVTIRQQTVYFVHQSAKTYILSETVSSPGLGMEHRAIAVRCLQYICDGPPDDLLGDDADFLEYPEPKPETHTRAEYPALFWLDHARAASDDITAYVDVDGEFFKSPSKQREDWFDMYWDKTHAKWEEKPSQFTALHLGAYAGILWLVSSLLKPDRAVDVTATDSLGNDALMWASRNGHTAVVRFLLSKGADLAAKNLNGITALYFAAENGHKAVVQLLAERGASIEIKNRVGWTALHRAAHHGHTGVITALLSHNADIEAQDMSRWTALQRAASSGQLSVIRLLLEEKADSKVQDKEGMTLLHIAAWNGHLDVISLLLKNGADIKATDEEGWTALQHAAWGGHTWVTRLLLHHGSDVNIKNVEGNTALHQATWNGHIAVIRLLLQGSANANMTCNNGETALQQAAWRGHVEAVQILLESNADPNIKSKTGSTALHQAASNGQEAVVKLLLESGADHTIEDDDGQTAYTIAQDNNHDSTARLLKERRPSGTDEEESLPTSDDEGGEPDLIRPDAAILEALLVKPEQCKIKPHGQAGFSNPSKITTIVDGETKYYFLKTGPNGDMFKGEHASLAALHLVVPSICPKALAHGTLSSSQGYFLLTEFLDVNDRVGETSSGLSLPQKLAKLHSTTAPIPEGRNQPSFGFPITTYCGSTPQSNTLRDSWSKFYAEDRLRAICKIIEQSHGTDDELRIWIEKIVIEVVPKLLRNGHLGGRRGIQPVLVHGDLWSGNKARGKIGDHGAIEDAVFDPSSCYAHSEYELGIMRMFGGFSAGFFSEYHRLIPKTQPKDEYEDRMELYQLYHYLNHYALFCGGYRDDAMDNMKRLYAKHESNEDD